MSQCLALEKRPAEQATPQKAGRQGLPLSVLFLTAGELLQGTVEERQLTSVIHQIFQNPRARQRLVEDPDGFIARLKVLPRVKAVLGLMQATLLTQRALGPEFNWWWGATPPDEEDEPLPRRPGSAGLPLAQPV